jgi:transposase
MAMGTRRRRAKQTSMWVAPEDLPRTAAHPFYTRLNHILETHEFDEYVEGLCERFYAEDGRPGLSPGRYFRLLLIGYFEALDAERAIAWRASDSCALREFLGLVLPDAPPDQSTISRTRRLIDLETHQAVFTWMLQRLADAGLVKGTTVGIDATTLEANAALRSIVRRDTGESYQDFLAKLAQASGIETPREPRGDMTSSTRPSVFTPGGGILNSRAPYGIAMTGVMPIPRHNTDKGEAPSLRQRSSRMNQITPDTVEHTDDSTTKTFAVQSSLYFGHSPLSGSTHAAHPNEMVPQISRDGTH